MLSALNKTFLSYYNYVHVYSGAFLGGGGGGERGGWRFFVVFLQFFSLIFFFFNNLGGCIMGSTYSVVIQVQFKGQVMVYIYI